MEQGSNEKLIAEVDTAAALLAFRSSQVGPGDTALPQTVDNNEQHAKREETITGGKPKKELLLESRCREHQHGGAGQKTMAMLSPPNTSSNLAAANASRILSNAAGLSATQQMMMKGQNQASLHVGQLTSYNSLAHALSPFFFTQSPLSSNQAQVFESAASVQQDIRKEEVEKALRSKPQRGRKRSNLNHDERQELARTRNREHAKSTRMRKKLRLEELLKIESNYREVMQREQLKQSRVAKARELLQRRQERHFLLPKACQIASSSNDDSSERDCSLLSSSCLAKLSPACQDSIKAMQQMDLALSDHAIRQHGPHVRIEIRYSDLALCIDSESAVMHVHIRVPEKDVLLKSTLTKVVFANNSDSIVSVQETVLRDLTTTSDHSELQTQPSHPSVISLDDKATQVAIKAASSDGGDDCGMFI